MSNSLIQQFAASSQLSGGNAAFVEELYEAYLRDPTGVAPEWRSYFDTFKGREAGDVPHSDAIARIETVQKLNGHARAASTQAGADAHAQKQAGVLKLVTAYRSRGHIAAQLDPLDLEHRLAPADLQALGLWSRPNTPDLDPAFHGLGPADMHTIKERAVVENGAVVAAPMMYVAISYDHRIIDGKDAVLFLVDIKNQLENPQRMLLGL